MHFSIRPFPRFSVHCSVACNNGPFQSQDTVWNWDEIATRMTSDQVSEAKKLARHWKPKSK
jgi:hypothetical protein